MKHWLFAYICLAIIKFSQQIEDDENFRLPKSVVPEYYKLKIKTILDEDNFMHISSVGINILCVEPTNRITLHSRNLTITNVKLYSLEDKHTLQIKPYTNKKYDFLHIGLVEELEDDTRYRLKINFEGEISNKMSGYYRSSYKNAKGEDKWIATTFFEPTNARSAFPCFDEPALRAVFSIEITHPKNYVALSNMPLKSYSYNYGWSGKIKGSVVWVSDLFFDTPKIPTYLVAYTVTEFASITAPKSNNYGETTLKIWAPSQSLWQVEYANEISPQIFSFFEEYFDIAYPLPKSDVVVIPDSVNSAMENWGLISFRESDVIYLPGKSTKDDKHSIMVIIAQQFAHYWFGNLVTINWWQNLWLKEGFSRYLSKIVVENVMPKWRMSHILKTILINLYGVYEIDGMKTSRALSFPIRDPNTIYELFEMKNLIYCKGAYVIRMMENFLGVDILKEGLRQYLKSNEYSSTGKDDLWNALSEVIEDENLLPEDVSIRTIMNTWTEQAGFPLITMVRDYSSGTVTLTQSRYLEMIKANSPPCYWIPVSYTTEKVADFNNTKPKLWMPCPKTAVTFDFKNADEWILLNIQATGIYRVNYDEDNWKMIIKQLHTNHKKIQLLNRILLIEDVIELAMVDHLDFNVTFDLINYISKETDVQVWRRMLQKLDTLRDFLYSLPQKALIEEYIDNIIKPKFIGLGSITNVTKFKKLTTLIIETACKYRNKNCEDAAVEIFKKWMKCKGDYVIPEEIRAIVYCQGLKHGDKKTWDSMWKRYGDIKRTSEKNKVLDALGCAKLPALLKSYLDKIITNDSGLRYQDVKRVFKSVITNEHGFQIARLFFYENIKYIYDMMSPPGSQMSYFLPLIARSLNTVADKIEFKQNAKTHLKYFGMARITLNQMLEKLIIWEKWYDIVYPKFTPVLERVVAELKDKKPETTDLITTEKEIEVETTTISATTISATPKYKIAYDSINRILHII